MIITIDGPASSGKSTAARVIAHHLGLCHINSGLLYRALAYGLVHTAQYDMVSIATPAEKDIDAVLDPQRMQYDCKGQAKVIFDGEDITSVLRDAAVGAYTAVMSAYQPVRSRLRTFQYRIANEHDCIVDGRDTGTKVFPTADIKIFLTASLPVRAARWQAEQAALGNVYSQADAERLLHERDTKDKDRIDAAMHQAVLIDTSCLTQEQMVRRIEQEIEKKRGTEKFSAS